MAERTFDYRDSPEDCGDLYQYINLDTFTSGGVGLIRELIITLEFTGNCEYGFYLYSPSTNQTFYVRVTPEFTPTMTQMTRIVNANSLYYTVADQFGVYIRSRGCTYYGTIKNPSVTIKYTNKIN